MSTKFGGTKGKSEVINSASNAGEARKEIHAIWFRAAKMEFLISLKFPKQEKIRNKFSGKSRDESLFWKEIQRRFLEAFRLSSFGAVPWSLLDWSFGFFPGKAACFSYGFADWKSFLSYYTLYGIYIFDSRRFLWRNSSWQERKTGLLGSCLRDSPLSIFFQESF